MLSCREFDALQLKLKRAAPFPQWRPCWRYTADRPFSLLQCSESLSQRPTSTCSYLKGTGSHIWTICPVSFWTNIDRRHVFQNTGQMHAWLTTVEQLQAAIIHVQQSSSTQCGCSCSMLCNVWHVSNYLLPMCVYIPYVQQCISNGLPAPITDNGTRLLHLCSNLSAVNQPQMEFQYNPFKLLTESLHAW